MSQPPTRRPTRSRNAAALTALTLLAAGCAAEDAQQEAAREEVQKHVRALPAAARYDADDVHCTDAAKTFFREEETSEFTCAVRVADGGCDWFAVRVDRDRGRVHVALQQREAGCSLGFGD
jgi:hypothetical protein